MLLSTFRRQLYRRGWEKVTYKDMLRGPLGRLTTCLIALGIEERATKITFGLPPGRKLGDDDVAEILAYHERTMESVKAATEDLRKGAGDQPEGPVEFHRRDGLPEVPWWREVDGRWFRGRGIPAPMFPYLPQHLCERLVSLDRKPSEGGKAEWIEYTHPFESDTPRRFVRADLVLEPNQSFTVELRETRVVGDGATVWWRQREV